MSVKLSIIMPCFNVAETLVRALDSIAMQRVDFAFEVIIVDDASTDGTLAVARKYGEKVPWLKVIVNSVNSGNAKTFYRGLQVAEGEYFTVLDGDDYYTVPDKLQKQIDFLEHDERKEYVGTATRYVMVFGDGAIHVPPYSRIKEFTYEDFLNGGSGYYHTATYVYRNIFKDNVPVWFSMQLYRGDTPRTAFALMYSRKRIRVLNFVGSAYNYTKSGIWSKLDAKQQFDYQINYLKQHLENVRSVFERKAVQSRLRYNEQRRKSIANGFAKYPSLSIDEVLENVHTTASRLAFKQSDYVFDSGYFSEYIDSLLSTMGYVFRVNNPFLVQDKRRTDNLAIVNGILNPHGGGIFQEIVELIKAHEDKNVYLFVTDMKFVSAEVRAYLPDVPNLHLVCPPPELKTGRLAWLYERMREIAPFRTYYYCSHSDVYGVALVQSGLCENVCLFSFDHGCLCGVSNSQLDRIVAKRPVDYRMLKRMFGTRCVYLPTWSESAQGCEGLVYRPFEGHDRLITASGAARFYKVDGRSPFRYVDYIANLLKRTHGRHYHFGPMPEAVLREIRERLTLSGCAADAFVHIAWSDNIPRDLLLNNVDVFIEPFPVVSFKLSLLAMSIGMPILTFAGQRRMEIADFVPTRGFRWRTETEFIDTLCRQTKKDLLRMSEEMLQCFRRNHDIRVVLDDLKHGRYHDAPESVVCTDDCLNEIFDSLCLFGRKISIAENCRWIDLGCEEASKELVRRMRASISYRVGCLLMFPWRWLKIFLREAQLIGYTEAWRRMKRPDALEIKGKTWAATAHAIWHSRTFKLGRLVTYPLRVVRNLIRS